jgi:hypothetical protein
MAALSAVVLLFSLQEPTYILLSNAVVPNLWFTYPLGYSVDRLGVRENNTYNG